MSSRVPPRPIVENECQGLEQRVSITIPAQFRYIIIQFLLPREDKTFYLMHDGSLESTEHVEPSKVVLEHDPGKKYKVLVSQLELGNHEVCYFPFVRGTMRDPSESSTFPYHQRPLWCDILTRKKLRKFAKNFEMYDYTDVRTWRHLPENELKEFGLKTEKHFRRWNNLLETLNLIDLDDSQQVMALLQKRLELKKRGSSTTEVSQYSNSRISSPSRQQESHSQIEGDLYSQKAYPNEDSHSNINYDEKQISPPVNRSENRRSQSINKKRSNPRSVKKSNNNKIQKSMKNNNSPQYSIPINSRKQKVFPIGPKEFAPPDNVSPRDQMEKYEKAHEKRKRNAKEIDPNILLNDGNHIRTFKGHALQYGPIFLIRDDVAPMFIGSKGVHIRQLRKKTTVFIDIDRFENTACGYRFIHLAGSVEVRHVAIPLVVDRLAKYLDKHEKTLKLELLMRRERNINEETLAECSSYGCIIIVGETRWSFAHSYKKVELHGEKISIINSLLLLTTEVYSYN